MWVVIWLELDGRQETISLGFTLQQKRWVLGMACSERVVLGLFFVDVHAPIPGRCKTKERERSHQRLLINNGNDRKPFSNDILEFHG